MTAAPAGPLQPVRRVTVAHPSPDLYGSDRQLLESIDGMRAAGADVTVCVPQDGPLVALLEEHGARVRVVPFPVLRRALLRPAGLVALAYQSVVALTRLITLLRDERPDVVYVNTLTMPVWLLAARLARRPVLCHVHEAEESGPRAIRLGLTAPLLLAHAVVANSAASGRALTDVLPRLDRRIIVVPNGVRPRGQSEDFSPPPTDTAGTARLAVVGRLSPRKGIDVALEALAVLRGQGRDIELDVCGTPFTGYEWYEAQLRDRSEQPDLRGSVHFLGYVDPTWPVLARADVVLVPSRVEPFGNTAVEGLLAGRPVIASRTQGLAEILDDGRTGLLVPPDDAPALAGAIARVLDDAHLASGLAQRGRTEALERFSADRYRRDIAAIVGSLASRVRTRPGQEVGNSTGASSGSSIRPADEEM